MHAFEYLQPPPKKKYTLFPLCSLRPIYFLCGTHAIACNFVIYIYIYMYRERERERETRHPFDPNQYLRALGTPLLPAWPHTTRRMVG